MNFTRRSIIAAVAATVVLGLLAIPGNAAPEKQFSLQFPTSLSAGTQNIVVPLKNETPNGNSNINSFRITAATAPAGFAINSITPGTGVLSNGNKTISVTGINTLKPQQTATYTLNITVPNLGCAGGSITWTGAAFTGNSLNGDPFRLHTQTESSPVAADHLDLHRMHDDLGQQVRGRQRERVEGCHRGRTDPVLLVRPEAGHHHGGHQVDERVGGRDVHPRVERRLHGL